MTHNSQFAPRNVAYDALVLNARSRQALVSVRSLGRRGLRVAALETCDGLPIPAFSSRWCHHKVICPAEEGTKDNLTYLEQVALNLLMGVPRYFSSIEGIERKLQAIYGVSAGREQCAS